MKNMLIVHDGDSDGRTAAVLMVQAMLLGQRFKFPAGNGLLHDISDLETIRVLETRDRNEIPWIDRVTEDTILVILDLTYKEEHFRQLAGKTNRIIVIDHHEGYDFGGFTQPPALDMSTWIYEFSDSNVLLHHDLAQSTTKLAARLHKQIADRYNWEHPHTEYPYPCEVISPKEAVIYVDIGPTDSVIRVRPRVLFNEKLVAAVHDFDVQENQIPHSDLIDLGYRRYIDEQPTSRFIEAYRLVSDTIVGNTFQMDSADKPDQLAVLETMGAWVLSEILRDTKAALEKKIVLKAPTSVEGFPDNMGTFMILDCKKYQTQASAMVFSSHPEVGFLIMLNNDETAARISLRRSHHPGFSEINVSRIAEAIGQYSASGQRGGGHAGAAGVWLTPDEWAAALTHLRSVCEEVT